MPNRTVLEQTNVLAKVAAITTDAIIVTDTTFIIQFFNRSAEKAFGYMVTEMWGQTLHKLLSENDIESLRQQLSEQSAPTRPLTDRAAVTAHRKSGETFPAEVTIAKFRHSADLYYALILRDMSERVAQEQQQYELRKQRDQLEAMQVTLRTLTNVVVSDLNLLNSMLGRVQTEQPLTPLEMKEGHKIVSHALDHIRQLTLLEQYTTQEVAPDVTLIKYN